MSLKIVFFSESPLKKLVNVNAKKVKAKFADEVSRAKMMDFADSINLNGPQGQPYTGRDIPIIGETRGETFMDKIRYASELIGLNKKNTIENSVIENIDQINPNIEKLEDNNIVKEVIKALWDNFIGEQSFICLY